MKLSNAIGGLAMLGAVANADVAEAADTTLDLTRQDVVEGLFDGVPNDGADFVVDPAAFANLCEYVDSDELDVNQLVDTTNKFALVLDGALQMPTQKEARKTVAQTLYDSVTEPSAASDEDAPYVLTSSNIGDLETELGELKDRKIGGEGTTLADVEAAMEDAKKLEEKLTHSLELALKLYEEDGEHVLKVKGDHTSDVQEAKVVAAYQSLALPTADYQFACPEQLVQYSVENFETPFPSYEDSKSLRDKWGLNDIDADQVAPAAAGNNFTSSTPAEGGATPEKTLEVAVAEYTEFVNVRLKTMYDKVEFAYKQVANPKEADDFRDKNRINGKNAIERLFDR